MMGNSENWQDDSIDLVSLLKLLWSHRWWIFVSTVASAVIAGAIGFWMTPIYRASTVLVSANVERSGLGSISATLGQLGGLASLAGINLGSSDSDVEETLAVLRSREFLEKFITEKNLMPFLFADKWNLLAKKWNVSASDQPTMGDAYRYLKKNVLVVTQDKKTNLVTLLVDWRDRKQSADWANELVKRINSEMRLRAAEKADASISYLKNELNSTSDVGTRDAINRLVEAQVKQRMLANVSQEYAFRVVDHAVVPDLHDKISPRKTLMALGGAFLGLLASVSVILLLASLRRPYEANKGIGS